MGAAEPGLAGSGSASPRRGGATVARRERGYRHEALLYATPEEFLAGTAPFITRAVREEVPVLVVVSAEKIELLRRHLGWDARRVDFADMAEVGHNPARIIPMWRQFIADHGGTGQPARGIGEPITPARQGAELVECQIHEILLNAAFADCASFWLLCPYDTSALPASVIEEAHRSHPFVAKGTESHLSLYYRSPHRSDPAFSDPLPEPPRGALEDDFDGRELAYLGALVSGFAAGAGLSVERASDLMLAVNEAARNSLNHGGGRGRFRMWREPGELGQPGRLVCQIDDDGHITDLLVGRELPPPSPGHRHGLALVQELCDLVQLRSSIAGTTVRMHVRLDPPPRLSA